MSRTDRVRLYATAAFVEYYKLGCPTRKQYEDYLRNTVYKKLEQKDPQTIMRVADNVIFENRALLADLDAVDKTFSMLYGNIPMVGINRAHALKNGADVAEAVKGVYFGLHRGKPATKRIHERVVAHAVSVYADPSTVYRWLAQARALFAVNRGLVMDNDKSIDQIIKECE